MASSRKSRITGEEGASTPKVYSKKPRMRQQRFPVRHTRLQKASAHDASTPLRQQTMTQLVDFISPYEEPNKKPLKRKRKVIKKEDQPDMRQVTVTQLVDFVGPRSSIQDSEDEDDADDLSQVKRQDRGESINYESSKRQQTLTQMVHGASFVSDSEDDGSSGSEEAYSDNEYQDERDNIFREPSIKNEEQDDDEEEASFADLAPSRETHKRPRRSTPNRLQRPPVSPAAQLTHNQSPAQILRRSPRFSIKSERASVSPVQDEITKESKSSPTDLQVPKTPVRRFRTFVPSSQSPPSGPISTQKTGGRFTRSPLRERSSNSRVDLDSPTRARPSEYANVPALALEPEPEPDSITRFAASKALGHKDFIHDTDSEQDDDDDDATEYGDLQPETEQSSRTIETNPRIFIKPENFTQPQNNLPVVPSSELDLDYVAISTQPSRITLDPNSLGEHSVPFTQEPSGTERRLFQHSDSYVPFHDRRALERHPLGPRDRVPTTTASAAASAAVVEQPVSQYPVDPDEHQTPRAKQNSNNQFTFTSSHPSQVSTVVSSSQFVVPQSPVRHERISPRRRATKVLVASSPPPPLLPSSPPMSRLGANADASEAVAWPSALPQDSLFEYSLPPPPPWTQSSDQ